jgi:hypothetical protein
MVSVLIIGRQGTCVEVPPDVAWVGPLAGCGGWLGMEMDPPWFCVAGLLLPALLGGLLLPVLLGEVLAGVLVASAG